MSISSAYANVTNARTARDASREQLDLQKKASDFAMVQAGYNPETLDILPNSNADVQAAKNNETLQLAKALQAKLAAQDTDVALLDYSATGDASYLQKAMEKNPAIKQAWSAKGVQTVANIDWQNDTQILDRAGFKPSFYDTPEKQEVLKKNVYKTYTGKDWNVGLLNNVVKEVGTLSRLGMNKGQVLLDNFQSFRDLLSGPKVSPNTVEGHKYEKEITAAANETGVPPNLIASMMKQESRNNPNAVSPKGAAGLMQLMPDTATELGVTDLTDPAQNIMAGAKYLAKNLEKFNGNTALALAAYNAGPRKVAEYGGVPPFQETQDYVSTVLSNYKQGESYSTKVTEAGLVNKNSTNAIDQRINTIRQFYRDNANAAAGTTSAIVDQEAADKSTIAQANLTDSKARLINANANTIEANANLVDAEAKLKTSSTPKDTRTEKQKDLGAAQEATQSLLSNFGGEDKFFSTDFKDPKNFNKAWPEVVKINRLEGTELSQEDKKNITNIRGLVALANPASKMTASQTGMLDTQIADVLKYITDDTSGVDKKAAMASFRNTLRNALYGSTLTDGEIAAFNEAFGSNKQKLGPVLTQFKVALGQVQEKLSSTSNLGNPYTMHVLLGADEKKLQQISSALQQRIDYIDGKYNPVDATKASRKPLAEIFGASK